MAKFLNTTGVSYHLEELIKSTKERLFLISPYLQFSKRIKEHISNLNIQKKDIRIVYRENKLQFEENNWLEKQIGVRTSICKNLHAKCYLNEQEAIVTSMNLYEFSQQNNNEMGIYFSKVTDPELYASAFDEVSRLLTISEEIRVKVQKISPFNKDVSEHVIVSAHLQAVKYPMGYCIRNGVQIPFNLEKPMSYDAFKSWSYWGDPDFAERFCHFSGEASNGETSVNRPILKRNWKKAKEIFNL